MNRDVETILVRLRYRWVMQDLREHTSMLYFVTLQCTPRYKSIVWPTLERLAVWPHDAVMSELHITRVPDGYWTFDAFYVDYKLTFNKKFDPTWLATVMRWHLECALDTFKNLLLHDPHLFK